MVSKAVSPNMTCPILIAANEIPPIASTLKITPKYNALKPLKNFAGLPE